MAPSKRRVERQIGLRGARPRLHHRRQAVVHGRGLRRAVRAAARARLAGALRRVGHRAVDAVAGEQRDGARRPSRASPSSPPRSRSGRARSCAPRSSCRRCSAAASRSSFFLIAPLHRLVRARRDADAVSAAGDGRGARLRVLRGLRRRGQRAQGVPQAGRPRHDLLDAALPVRRRRRGGARTRRWRPSAASSARRSLVLVIVDLRRRLRQAVGARRSTSRCWCASSSASPSIS